MPPSPSARRLSERELKVDNHKRGRSLEGGILFRENDDDLALFNEVQDRGTDNFLLQSTDDFEDTFSTKLRYFSGDKHGLSLPVRGESSNLLNAEEEKNDYDWLLTPPDTPLFTSLDDQVPPLNFPQRGRPRSQPITISRSSTMEKSRRSSRGSASPNRLSLSPRSGSGTVQARDRTSSASHSSPTPRPVSPLRRPSPPPGKISTPTRRSTTPTLRRVSTSSISTVASSGIRGTSPVKSSRGNSASPKVRAWQANIPGFPTEAPPNLRTSLADRPASFVRGSSPASRNGREFSSRSGRQSMSPTTTRSISSSYSHDRDPFSSHSKGSIASSGDDDVDSLVSIPVGRSERSATRQTGSLLHNRAPAFSKKPSRTVTATSAPKRSFDMALRQMDHRKSPQNMFRPLLSSVPSTTLNVGKTSATQHAITSRNSITTSNNESSDVTGEEHDTEGSEQYQEDVTSAFVEAPSMDTQDEVFDFDKLDDLNETVRHETQEGFLRSQHANLGESYTADCHADSFDNHSDHCTAITTAAIPEALHVKNFSLDDDGPKDMVLCQSCGHAYFDADPIEGVLNFCPDCRSDVLLTISNVVTATTNAENSLLVSTHVFEESGSFDGADTPVPTPVSAGVTSIAESGNRQCDGSTEENQGSYSEPIGDNLSMDSVSGIVVEEGNRRYANQQVADQPTVSYNVPDGCAGGQQMQKCLDYPTVNASGGAGISVLLDRSRIGRGGFLQSRSFTASSTSFDDSSYVRDSAYSLRSSYGHGSLSTSSSVDLGSYRQIESRVQRQLSVKSDSESYRYDVNIKHRRTGSSLSVASNPALHPSSLTTDMLEQSSDVSFSQLKKDAVVKVNDSEDQLLSSENMEDDYACTDDESNYKSRTMDASSESSTHILNIHQRKMLTSVSNSEESSLNGNGAYMTNNVKNVRDVETSIIYLESSSIEKESVPSSSVDIVKVPVLNSQSFLDIISEEETVSVCKGPPCIPSDTVSSSLRSSFDELHNTTTFKKDITTLLAEPDNSNHEHGSPVECKSGFKARSTTLDEATDTILLCSSIVHDMAYNAATIATEKENPDPLEGSSPMVTLLGNVNPEKKDALARTAVKRTPKSQKAKPSRAESKTKPPSDTNNDDIDVSTDRMVKMHNHNNTESVKAPPKLESKCNCTIM